MRRINVKLLLILTIAFCLVLGVGGAIWYSNSDRASDEFLKRAQTAEQEGNLRKAIGSYLRYLAFQPTDQVTLAYQGSDNRAAAKEALEFAKILGLGQSISEPSEKSKYERLLSWLEN